VNITKPFCDDKEMSEIKINSVTKKHNYYSEPISQTKYERAYPPLSSPACTGPWSKDENTIYFTKLNFTVKEKLSVST
jgi:hypothetical protein